MILAIQTPDHTTDLWLLPSQIDQDPLAHIQWESGRELSSQLHERILGLLASQQATLDDLTGVIIFSGPGSFTSLRIGHTVANALADSLTIPVVGSLKDDWINDARHLIQSAQIGVPTLPYYGSEAHITKPKS